MKARYRLYRRVLETAQTNVGATTPEELAAACRCSVATLLRWRDGQSCPDAAGLMRLFKLTGLDLGSMLYQVD